MKTIWDSIFAFAWAVNQTHGIRMCSGPLFAQSNDDLLGKVPTDPWTGALGYSLDIT